MIKIRGERAEDYKAVKEIMTMHSDSPLRSADSVDSPELNELIWRRDWLVSGNNICLQYKYGWKAI